MSESPEDVQPGDYWKILNSNGLPKPPDKSSPSNLTGTCWFVVAPKNQRGGGFALGRLELHTVREHDDGTISVRRGDGSSNSIDILGANGFRFHGYIEHGVWETLPDSVLT
jgi:hypothetical protein